MSELLDLHWDVFVTPGIPTVTSDRPPGTTQQLWSPIASTLISGKRDAILVDTFLTVEPAGALVVDGVAARGKNLTTIDATHGHGDHCFGASIVLQRCPRTRLVATQDVVKMLRQQASPQGLASFWHPRFPGLISAHRVIAEALTANVMALEGHEVVVGPLGQTDTDNTTCVQIPSMGLVVAGDATSNGVHLWLGESHPHTRRAWMAALDTIEALNPRVVIARHKRHGNDDSPTIIEETRQYIRDVDRVAETTTTARELYDTRLECYPERVNPGLALWLSARAVTPSYRSPTLHPTITGGRICAQ